MAFENCPGAAVKPAQPRPRNLPTGGHYRSGLQLRRHSPEDVAREFSLCRAAVTPRLSGKALCHTLVFEAAACCQVLDVPLQVHCGLGDPDEDLALASPLGLRPLFEDPGATAGGGRANTSGRLRGAAVTGRISRS